MTYSDFYFQLRNDDGVWVRLNPDTVRKYCQNGFTEAWCLQYNQHLGKTLLIPVEVMRILKYSKICFYYYIIFKFKTIIGEFFLIAKN